MADLGDSFVRSGFPYTVFDLDMSGSLVGKNYFKGIYAVPVGAVVQSNSCGEARFYLANQTLPTATSAGDGSTPTLCK
jgi:hypothetical protein